MTLSEQAAFICEKVSQSEAEDLAACKGFLRRRFEMLWHDQLWKDAVVEYQQTLSSTGYDATATWLPTKQVLLLPHAIARVLAVRTGERQLRVQSPQFYYRIDFNAFSQTGAAVEWMHQAACAWELDTSRLITISGQEADAGAVVTTRLATDDGEVTTTSWALPQGLGTGPSSVIGRIDAFTKAATSAAVSMADASDTFLALSASATSAPRRCRIRLIGTPADGTVLRVLAKANPPAFTNDNDEPALAGVENCLLAFAQADMLQRERQYGKAQLCQQEGQALLDQLKREEVVQQAHNQRIIPEDGYGDPYDLWGHSPLTF